MWLFDELNDRHGNCDTDGGGAFDWDGDDWLINAAVECI